jgi:hypothetical protein
MKHYSSKISSIGTLVKLLKGIKSFMPNKALQPTWQGAAKNFVNAFLCLSVKCFLEEAGPRG